MRQAHSERDRCHRCRRTTCRVRRVLQVAGLRTSRRAGPTRRTPLVAPRPSRHGRATVTRVNLLLFQVPLGLNRTVGGTKAHASKKGVGVSRCIIGHALTLALSAQPTNFLRNRCYGDVLRVFTDAAITVGPPVWALVCRLGITDRCYECRVRVRQTRSLERPP